MSAKFDTEILFKNLSGSVSEITLQSYRDRMKMLTTATEKPLIDSLTGDVDELYKKLQKKYDSATTRKNIVSTILSLYSHTPKFDKAHEETRKEWEIRFKNVKQIQKEIAGDNRLTADKEKTMPTAKEISEAARKMSHDDMKESQMLLLLLMVSVIPPKRRDYGALKVHKSMPKAAKDNFVVVPTHGKVKLVLTEYKTANKYGTFSEDLPEEISDAMRESLKRHPRGHVFVGRDLGPMTDNAYGKFVKAAFTKYVKKASTMNDLRHAYISQKISSNKLTRNEKEAIARRMQHGLDMQDSYQVVGFSEKAESKDKKMAKSVEQAAKDAAIEAKRAAKTAEQAKKAAEKAAKALELAQIKATKAK